MNIAGIICEYNPLHSGHVYHISETKRLLGEECAVVCAMSGNFVQRGELAVFDKHARARAAVLCGADLVIELPTTVSLSSAERFAEGGIRLLDALGVCTHLSFGSETGELSLLSKTADALFSESADALIREELSKGVSYATARQAAAERLLGDTAQVLQNPNDTLGVEYLRALKRLSSPMKPVCVKREGGAHDADAGLSASAVRTALFSGDDAWAKNIPEQAREVFMQEIAAGRAPVTALSLETAMLSRLRSMSRREYEDLPDAGEGLSDRLARYAGSEPTLEDVLGKTKTKRYAMSRLRRMVLCAYLGVTAKDIAAAPQYIRVLAANERGCGLLKTAQKTAKLPIVTKPASALSLGGGVSECFAREAKFTDLYVLARPESAVRTGGSEYRQSPFILK